MGIFSNLVRTPNMAESSDYEGGFQYLDTDIYKAKIISAYADVYKSGAQFVVIKYKVTKKDGTTQDLTGRYTITNKNNKFTYLGKDGIEYPYPGYDLLDQMCWLLTGKPLSDQDAEVKNLPIYSVAEGKEVPQPVQCLVELFGQEILVGIQKIRKNKEAKDASGNYIKTSDEKIENEVVKVWHPDYKATVKELRMDEKNGVDPNTVEHPYFNKWLSLNQGKTKDTYTETIGATTTSTTFGGNTGAASAQSRVFGQRAS